MIKTKVKYLTTGLILGISISATLFSFGETKLKTIQAVENSIKVKVNNQELSGDNYIIEGRTYLQARDIVNAVGKDIKWDSVNGVVDITDKVGESNKPVADKVTIAPTPTPEITKQVITHINDLSYEHFKANFEIGELILKPNTELLNTNINFIGNLNSTYFEKWWDTLNKETFIEQLALEIHAKNPKLSLCVMFKCNVYKTEFGNQLGNVTIDKYGHTSHTINQKLKIVEFNK